MAEVYRHQHRFSRAAFGCLVGLCCAACATFTGSGPPSELVGNDRWLLVPAMKLRPQVGDHGCGPAALSMVLARWGVADEPGKAPGARGVSAGELRDRARALGLESYVVPGSLDDLRHELKAGHPVVLGLARREMLHAYFHFVVLVGGDADGSEWLVADPDRGWRRLPAKDLMAEWEAASRIMVVAYPKTLVSGDPSKQTIMQSSSVAGRSS
jgi:hypothetical protein